MTNASKESHENAGNPTVIISEDSGTRGTPSKPIRPRDLGRRMADLARELQGAHNSVEETLSAITAAAVTHVPGVSFACITQVSLKQDVSTVAATDVRAEKLNSIQQTVGQGPCLQSLWEFTTISVVDLRADKRWPMYALAAVDLEVLSLLTVRLYVGKHDLGALSLYSEQAGAFTEESEVIASLLATHAALALTAAQQQANLFAAVNSRDIIGQAKGMLMERYQLDSGRAFRLLVRVSQTTNTPLREVADQLLSTGEIPAVERRQPQQSTCEQDSCLQNSARR